VFVPGMIFQVSLITWEPISRVLLSHIVRLALKKLVKNKHYSSSLEISRLADKNMPGTTL
jgi:hypothetical protein